jgi:hypothetical protein
MRTRMGLFVPDTIAFPSQTSTCPGIMDTGELSTPPMVVFFHSC